jgi:hypothetical protein
MTDFLQDLGTRVKALSGDWATYMVLGNVLLYVVGYLTLRFHLTAMGIGTDLAVVDERYWFTGARFIVYLLAAVPSILLLALPVAAVAWGAGKLFGMDVVLKPRPMALFGIIFAVVMIQFVMRQCFFFSNLLLAGNLPAEPAWLVTLLLDDQLMPLYFAGLVAASAIPFAILVWLRAGGNQTISPFLMNLLLLLAVVQILLLPINYGILIVDKSVARVTAVGKTPLASGEEAWLVWEGQNGVTYLVRRQADKHRALVTVPRADADRTEIVGFDRIFPTLFRAQAGGQ